MSVLDPVSGEKKKGDDRWNNCFGTFSAGELIIKIKGNSKTLVVMLALLTPGLPPHELQAAGRCKVLFNGVVDPLNEHAGQVGPLEHIGHGGAVTKRVDRPGTARSYACDRRV